MFLFLSLLAKTSHIYSCAYIEREKRVYACNKNVNYFNFKVFKLRFACLLDSQVQLKFQKTYNRKIPGNKCNFEAVTEILPDVEPKRTLQPLLLILPRRASILRHDFPG